MPGVQILNYWQSLFEPLLYRVLSLGTYRTTALAASITNGEMNTAHKVGTWTRTIIVHNEPTSDNTVKDALDRILSSARNLAVFKSPDVLDLSARAIPAIARDIEVDIWAGDIGGLTLYNADGILSHLGRFEQLRKLSLGFYLQWDGNDPTSVSLAPVNLPQLESLSLFIEETSVEEDSSVISPFSVNVFTLFKQSHLPKLRRVHVDLHPVQYPERANIGLTDVLSSFFARHRDLNFAYLSGCDDLLSHILAGLGVMRLQLSLDDGPPEMLYGMLHPRVATLSLETGADISRAFWTGLEHLSDGLGAHASLRALEIIEPYHSGAYLHFDGETVAWLSDYLNADNAPAHLYTERKGYEDDLMRVARSLAEKGVSLRVINSNRNPW
jgi:hypothetical protein